MTDFESKKKKGPPGKGPEKKKVRREDLLTDEAKDLWDKEKLLDEEIWKEETEERMEKKRKAREEGRKHDEKEKTPEEIEYDKLMAEFKRVSLDQKIKELKKKMEPPREKTPEEKEFEDLVKRFEFVKKQNEMDEIKKKIEEAEKARKPKEKSEFEKEREALEQELKYLEEVHKSENLKAKIKEAREKVADKSKYLKGKAASSSGGWFNFFETTRSKNITAGASVALGLVIGAFPLLIIGGLMFLADSDEKKAAKAKTKTA